MRIRDPMRVLVTGLGLALIIAPMTTLAAPARLMAPSELNVLVGAGQDTVQMLNYFPASIRVHAGDTVTFRLRGVNEIHTVTFGPRRYVEAIAARLFPPPPPPLILDPVGALPSQPPGTRVTLTATLHGNGFLNSGILADPRTAGSHSFTVRFTQPGTYRLDCLIHAGMQAVITVRARTQRPAEQANGAAQNNSRRWPQWWGVNMTPAQDSTVSSR